MSGSAVVLCILDGWGNGDGSECDAIHAAHKPFWESVASRCPRSSLSASGEDVGLPATQVGNSEVGHISLGAGRVVPQDLQRINAEIGGIHSNPYLLQFVDALRNGSGVCHIMGLLSDGGVHGLQDHITKLVQVFAELRVQVMIHAFLDGRDVPPRSAKKYVTALGEVVHSCGASIATVSGRYYAMDRDNRLDRTEKAYEAIALARGPRYRDAITAVESNYSDGISDEFLVPSVIGDYQGFSPGDGILLTNFRSDRIVQILSMILHRSQEVSNVLGMVRYSEKIQWRERRTISREDRVIIPSPQVSTYDLQPEMSAFPMTEVLVKHIESKQYSLVVVNYANADMVGHTGNLEAVKKAISVVDTCLQMVFDATRKAGATMLITADHGNAEKMFDTRGTPFTAHTSNTVPLVLCNCDKRFGLIDGRLCDVAPTILELMKIAKPDEMTGSSLLTLA
ncbi:hypothetical protein GH714_042774 [Hevea brasiliensis]|uniref:phosphoglycerate mutase (2,3-diphosphoglycerate-independent) n=1 Tax=Hevea brasiliensis TaxID=3981 RepID=A0A6A6JZD0_HEVBR|nr:hypothetical protein GH714_042774 [Hevea brasiliensis]